MALRLLAAVLIEESALFAAAGFGIGRSDKLRFLQLRPDYRTAGFWCPNADSTKTSLTYTNSGLSITTYGTSSIRSQGPTCM